MHRESIYVCTYTDGEDEHVGHVRAWDDREAAELFACEMEIESDIHAISVAEIRVRLVSSGDATARNAAR